VGGPEKDEFGEVVRLVLNPIWNAWSFYALYANADGLRGRLIQRANGVLDRYALAKTAELVSTVTARLEAYEIAEACNAVRVYLDALNNWYIRRSRPRFWSKEQGPEKQAAYDTLYTCLHTLLRVVAPAGALSTSLPSCTMARIWPSADSVP
jgi:isoleucyl-tRNA synthetase